MRASGTLMCFASAAGFGERFASGRLVALTSAGLVLVLAFAGAGRLNGAGSALGLAAVTVVVLAFLVFGETLGALQTLGGALVVGGVLALHVRVRRVRVAEAAA